MDVLNFVNGVIEAVVPFITDLWNHEFILDGVMQIFNGIIDFLVGVFTATGYGL